MNSYSLKHLLLLVTVAGLTSAGLSMPTAVGAAIATGAVFVVLAYTLVRTSWRLQDGRERRAFAIGVWMYFVIAFGPMSHDFKNMMPTTLALRFAYSQIFLDGMTESEWALQGPPMMVDQRREYFMHIGHCCTTIISGLVLASLPACAPASEANRLVDSG